MPCPSAKALRDLRRRVGAAPLRALFEVLAGPAAQPSTPGVRFGRYRTVSFDGCNSVKVPDTARNRAWLGKQGPSTGETGYPAIELMTLAETGTRSLLGAVFGPRTGETGYAAQLMHLLRPDMLVLTDRGFDSGGFLEAVAATGAQFLARLTSVRLLPALTCLDDGTYLARISGLTVRVIDAQVTVTLAAGIRFTARYRLATTLTDHRRYPAPALLRLYHERWEHEIAYLALRHTLLDGRVLRSGDPAGLAPGNLGPAGPLPGHPPRDGPRRRDRPRHRPRPRQLHHRPAGRPRHHRQPPGPARRPAPRPHRPRRPRPPCSRPAGPASASARSSPRSPAGTAPPRTGPPAAPR